MADIQYVLPVKEPKNANDLLTVFVNDFEDNYHRLDGEPSSDLERRVRRIRRRYKNISEYNQALTDYYEWMDYLCELNGGEKIFNVMLKNDAVPHYVPPKPRLKLNKELRYLDKHQIIVSGQSNNMKINTNKVHEMFDEMYGNEDYDNMSFVYDLDGMKEAQEIVQPRNKEINASGITFSAEDELDYLDKYFTAKTVTKFTNKKFGKKKKQYDKKKKKDKKKSNNLNMFGEPKFLISECHPDHISNLYDTTEEDELSTEVVFYNGRFVSGEEARELAIYEKMGELGWNSYAIMASKKYGKRAIKDLKRTNKKKNKKKKKGTKFADKLLMDMMTDNGYDDFAHFASEMENFTSDIVKGR